MFDLTGKTALVTGATGGIGGAIARALHQQGATVALPARGARRSTQLAGELGERVHVLPCNLADKDAVEALVPQAEEAMGKLDILVANAGITRDNLLVQLSDEDWDEVIAVNLTATFRLARAAVRRHDAPPHRPHHRHHVGGRRHRQCRAGQLRRGQGRHDRHDQVARARNMPSAASPRTASRRASSPSPMTDKLNDKQREAILARVPAGRLGDGADVAAAAVYLASDEAAYVTGQTLHVNGGMAMI